MEVPWPSGTCPDHPHMLLPFAAELIPNKSPHRHQRRIIAHLNSPPIYTSYTMLPPSISFILQETANAPHTLCYIPPPSFPHTILVAINGIQLASLVKRTRASAAGVRRHNHHAINYSWERNFKVFSFLLLSPGLQPHPSIRWGQDRHVWQIVRNLPIEAGWRNAPLALQRLAVINLRDTILDSSPGLR